MNKETVSIKINTIQLDKTTNEINEIEQLNQGIIKEVADEVIVSYYVKENNLKRLVIIKIKNDSLEVKKYKENSTMYFKKDVETITPYITMYGNLVLKIKTLNLKITKEEGNNLYKIFVDYDIIINELFDGNNKLNIEIKKIS